MRIGLLLSDFMPDEFRPVAGEYIDMFSGMLADHDVTLVPYDAYRQELPGTAGECDAYIISGSRSAVYQGDRWINDLKAFIREVVAEDVPMFGVCFGLQAMAEALGGTVEEFDGGWGGGVRTMRVSQQRPWMIEKSETVSLIMSHQDQVVALPERAVRLGSSRHCENFLVEFTPNHVGIQGHPEFTVPFAEAIYDSYRTTRGQAADEAITSLDRPTDSAVVVDWIRELLNPR